MALRVPVQLKGLVVILTLTSLPVVRPLDDPILSPKLFYPFGTDVGDRVITPNDDGSSGEIMINIGFPFFATSNTRLFVNTNGAISFGAEVRTFTPTPFPVSNRIIAPYWCDVDTTRNNGRVYYRESTDEGLLNRSTHIVLESFARKGLYAFKAKWIFVATWHNVTYYGGNKTTPINSFQTVLITDGRHSIAMFNYGHISWTAGTSSGGNPFTGLGGTAAQAGFNAGDNVTYFAIPGSRTDEILKVDRESNSGLKGRWIFRVDSAKIESSSACEAVGKCEAHQIFDNVTSQCTDVAPAFKCPTIEGPEVIERVWVEFYCVVPTNVTRADARFEVTFLFNGEPDDKIPVFTIQPFERRATLHEKHLTNKLIGKWISCRVVSFWANDATPVRSQSLNSMNSYFAGIEVSDDVISLFEGNTNPVILTLKSTIPITCQSPSDTKTSKDKCGLTIKFATTRDVIFRETNSDGSTCGHTLTELDWKIEEKKAYRDGYRIELFAKIDLIVSFPRYNTLTIDIDRLPDKTTSDGQTKYKNMWSKHTISDIKIYHNDVPNGVCRATGDPNLTTLDNLFYSIYATGQFTYVQTTHGPPIEVQVRQKACGQTVSCVCGVAVREKDLILMADMCTSTYVHTATYNDPNTLPRHVGIKKDSSGQTYRISLPSGVRVIANVMSWGLNLDIYMTSAEYKRTEGLCGSFDGNMDNDLKVKGATQSTTRNSLASVVESWRVPDGQSLFDGVLTNLNQNLSTSTDWRQGYCSCPGGSNSGCDNTIFDNNIISKEDDRFKTNTVAKVGNNTENVIQPLPQRRKREVNATQNTVQLMTDDIDWDYNTSSFYTEVNKSVEVTRNVAWPTFNGITLENATAHCRKVLWGDYSKLKDRCKNTVQASDVDGIVQKCVSDIKMTGDLSWAKDKIPEVESLCAFVTITTNITETNSTIEELVNVFQEISAIVCVPFDCSENGECRNGECHCKEGYIGSDCAHKADAIPKITRTLGPSPCDVSRFPCQKVRLLTEDTVSLPTVACSVQVIKTDNSTESVKTVATILTTQTASCELPTGRFQGGLRLLRSAPENKTDFYILPDGNPALYYSVSISNNGVQYSAPQPLVVYDSKCQTCDGQKCTQKNDTCIIKGYCFASDETNPWNPQCDICRPSVSSTSWTKLPDPACDPCQSSPCSRGATCVSPFKGEHRCIEESPLSGRTWTILTVCLATALGILIVFIVVIICNRCSRKKDYKDPSKDEAEVEMKQESGIFADSTQKLTP